MLEFGAADEIDVLGLRWCQNRSTHSLPKIESRRKP